MHIGSYEKMQAFRDEYLSDFHSKRLSILEIGSKDVNGTYRPIFAQPNWEYTGADIESGNNVNLILKNPYLWGEIPTNCYDVVVSGSLLEHVEYPWVTMIEVNRVLKEGGLTCHIAPAAGFEHRFPVDCYRYYPDGLNALCKWADLQPLKIYTDWHTNTSQDGGHVWKDSVLIAKKKFEANRRASQMDTLVTMMNGVIC
jgi:SAM-dependent methyltransferase